MEKGKEKRDPVKMVLETRDRELIREWLALLAPSATDTPAGFVASAAPLLLGAPYRRGAPGATATHLEGFDCVTLVETLLALRLALREPQPQREDALTSALHGIRFNASTSDGNGYASRRHYFTDWLAANVAAGRLLDVTRALGGKKRKKAIFWMSQHPQDYPPLAQPENWRAIRETELRLSRRGFYFIPKEWLRNIAPVLHQGDIIAFTSAQKGLDVAHCGMALAFGATRRLFHASSQSGRVEVSPSSIVLYAQKRTDTDGVIVARMR